MQTTLIEMEDTTDYTLGCGYKSSSTRMGQIIWFGFAAGFPQANINELLSKGFMKSAGIRMFTLYNIFEKSELFTGSAALLTQYLKEGKIKPHIHGKIPLSEAARAHQLMESLLVKGRLLLVP